jgi:anti-sigma-K factor RskA
MNDDAQLKLMAYVDGELPANEAAAIETQLKTDREAADLVVELRWAAEAISGNELELKVPESREFYWSKISRAIEFEEKQAQLADARPSDKWWYKILMPVAGMAAVALAFTFTLPTEQGDSAGEGVSTVAPVLEADPADVNVYEFYDERENMSVIWVTPGAETDPKSPQRDPLNQDDKF